MVSFPNERGGMPLQDANALDAGIERRASCRGSPSLVHRGVGQVIRFWRGRRCRRSACWWVDVPLAFGGESSRVKHAIGHPFDLTKTRLQTAAPGTYTGAIDVVKQAVARDGIKGCVRLYLFSNLVPNKTRFLVSTVVSFRHYWV